MSQLTEYEFVFDYIKQRAIFHGAYRAAAKEANKFRAKNVEDLKKQRKTKVVFTYNSSLWEKNVCVCGCVCVLERERERRKEKSKKTRKHSEKEL